MEEQVDQPPNEAPQRPPVNSKENAILTVLFLVLGLVISTLSTVSVFSLKSLHHFLSENQFIVGVITSTIITLTVIMFELLCTTKNTNLMFICYAVICILPAFLVVNCKVEVLLKSVLYTLLSSLVVTLLSTLIPDKISRSMLHYLGVVNFVIVVLTTCRIFVKHLTNGMEGYIDDFTIYTGLIVYAGLLVANTHRLMWNVRQPFYNALPSAFVFYMNIMNLFSRVITFYSRDFYLYILNSRKCK